MRTLKDCPACDFRPALNARVCAGCGHLFEDVAPVWIRNWIGRVARHLRRELPEASPEAFRAELEDRLLHWDELLEALDRADPEAPPEPGLVGEIQRGLRHLWSQVAGPESRRVEQIRWAIQEALEEMERGVAPDAED